MMLLKSPRERGRFLRFALVGAFGTLVDFAVFNLLILFLHVQPVVASVMSFLAAVTSNFTWNRYWTYPDSRSKPFAKQLGQFGLVNLIGLLIRTPIFVVSQTALLKLSPRLAVFAGDSGEHLAHNLALAVAIGVVLFWNFFINRYWTYNDVD